MPHQPRTTTLLAAITRLVPANIGDASVSDTIVAAMSAIVIDNASSPYFTDIRGGVMCTGEVTAAVHYCQYSYCVNGKKYEGTIKENPTGSANYTIDAAVFGDTLVP